MCRPKSKYLYSLSQLTLILAFQFKNYSLKNGDQTLEKQFRFLYFQIIFNLSYYDISFKEFDSFSYYYKMSDSKIPKRIFTTKSQALSIDPARTPSCYYHKFPITHFCVKKKCTLPLCQQCLPVHKRQHINNKEIPNEGIIQFETARNDALSAFQERKEEIQMVQEKFKSKVMEYKAKMVELITGLLDKFIEDCLVTDGNIQIIAQIQDKSSEIRRGSLKELIKYYQDIYGAEHFRKLYKMYTGEYLANFKFELDRKALEKITKDGIKNMNFPTQQSPIPEITQRDQQFEQNVIPKHPIKDSLPTTPIPSKDFNSPKTKVQIPKPKTERMQVSNPQTLVNKKVASEQDEESQISSYQLLKSKRRIEQGNIYTQNPSKLTQNRQIQHSHNSSNVSSTSKGKRKKGLSLAKSHKQLPNAHDTQSSNFHKQEDRNQRNMRRSNWRQFVNMKETYPQNDVIGGIRVNQPTSVLNPKQMRELIAKKKMEQKQRQLKTNKSAEFLIPSQRINN